MNPFDRIESDSNYVRREASEQAKLGNPFDSVDFNESRAKSIARSLYQIPSGIAQASTYPLDLIQMIGIGSSLDPEEIENIRRISEREGIPFDEEKYLNAVQQATETFPTQSNIERMIEEKTGAPLTPQTKFQKGLKLASTAGKFAPGNLIQKGVAAATAPAVKTGLEEAGVPEEIAELSGLALSPLAAKSLPTPQISKVKKPSGMEKLRFEDVKKPTAISEKRFEKINEKISSDFNRISKDIIEESPIGKTAEELANNPAYKQETRNLLNEAQEIANEIPGEIESGKLIEEIGNISGKQKKGYALSDYEKAHEKFMDQILQEVPETGITPGELVEQYRKNNAQLSEYFEPGASKAMNKAKRDSILDHNRAISKFMEKEFPDSDLTKVFKEGNERWSKIMDLETIDQFIEDLTQGKINFKKGQKFFDDPNMERIFKRSLGDEYPKFQQLMKDLLETEQPYKMLKIAKQQGFNDLASTIGAFIIHPTVGKAKLTYSIGKNTYRSLMNALLDKPKLMISFENGIKNFKKGKFKEAEKNFNQLQSQIQNEQP